MKTRVLDEDYFVFPFTKREAEQKGRPYSSQENRNRPFPRRLAQLRKDNGFSQQELADYLGVSKSTISLYETGDTVPDAKTIVALSDRFDVSTDYLLCQTNYTRQADELMTMESANLTEKAAINIHELDRIDGDGFIDYYRMYNSLSMVLSRVCEDDRFQSFMELLRNSCKEVKNLPEPEFPPYGELFFGNLSQQVNLEEYQALNLHLACDTLQAIVHDITLVQE